MWECTYERTYAFCLYVCNYIKVCMIYVCTYVCINVSMYMCMCVDVSMYVCMNLII